MSTAVRDFGNSAPAGRRLMPGLDSQPILLYEDRRNYGSPSKDDLVFAVDLSGKSAPVRVVAAMAGKEEAFFLLWVEGTDFMAGM